MNLFIQEHTGSTFFSDSRLYPEMAAHRTRIEYYALSSHRFRSYTEHELQCKLVTFNKHTSG